VVRAAHETRHSFVAHANWLEIGWHERGSRGVMHGPPQRRSRAVMERIGMRYAGEIRSRGIVARVNEEQADAPFTVCVRLRKDWTGRPNTQGT
jgi:hypothetical protein